MDAFITTFTSGYITALANLLQLVGLLVTVAVFFKLNAIRNRYTNLGRIPEQQTQLKQHASKIIEAVNNYQPQLALIQEELAKLGVVLKALKKRLKWNERGSINTALESIKNHERTPSVEIVRQIYVHIQCVIAEIEEREKDQRWS